ncbi:MAG TPA: glycosyltransferase family 2 protein [Acidimicrobiales bacterium]|nr:glycosyltransferase family 2 protein [Acidimicrobiales bacterium]
MPQGCPSGDDGGGATSVVIITRNRRDELLNTLRRIERIPDRPEIVVVDNDSGDGTADAVEGTFPRARVISLDRNRGAPARTVGVRAATSPVVAFADDDSWWAPGSLDRAASYFDRYPALGLLCARIIEEPDGTVHRASLNMAAAPLGRATGLPGPRILGHLACAAVVRRTAYLEVGGYSEVVHFGGEEPLLALDLAAAGWEQCYAGDVVAHHHPSPAREEWPARWARYRRNDTLTAWMRLPLRRALAETGQLLAEAAREKAVRRELPHFARLLARAWRQRQPVDRQLAADFTATLGA